nr:hypothetical protein [Tanacetum cinerariifolium]
MTTRFYAKQDARALVAESDPEEDPEEYEDDETEDGPVDYPMDEGDDGDDDDDNSSGDDVDDEDEDEKNEEGEEHLAPTDSTVVIPTDELVSPPEVTEPVIPPPSTDTTTTGARITVQMVETLRVMGGMGREMGDMQAELLALREQPRRAGQPGGDARVPNHQDAPRDADSHI